MPPSDRPTRSVQEPQEGYFRITIPPEYGKKYDELECIKSGKYLVFGPPSTNSIKPKDYTLPKRLEQLAAYKKPDHEEKHPLERYIEKTLQSLIISGTEQINIKYPSKWNKDTEFAVDKALSNQATENINISKNEITVNSDVDMGQYIDGTCDFINNYLLRPLSDDYSVTLNKSSNDLATVKRDEELDRWWAQVTHNVVNQFMNLERSYYPVGFCSLLIGKYLELLTDLTKLLIDSIGYLEDHFKEYSQAIEIFKNELYEVLTLEEKYNEQIMKSAKKAHQLDMKMKNYQNQLSIYNDRVKKLDKIRYASRGKERENSQEGPREEMIDALPDDLREVYDFGVSVGEICTLTARLVRFPRSIALTGITAESVASIHSIRPQNVQE